MDVAPSFSGGRARPASGVGLFAQDAVGTDRRITSDQQHSGVVSGSAPNRIFELSRLLAQLHDGKGRTTVLASYDDVAEA
ncbi:hypothetical protein Ade02nite_40620 [Paractinoplanes deccanensis]|uniref:Uncharacterized protein n=1 Tax=Paractinoplanes deccanensis TaxID=113561 RepID=A0ABQ3Y606_9ACTN|nr:hypothetical protein Ade02nite_40620 [Actinoplanes deccanensis]